MSHEGRKMELVKISKNPKANNSIMFIDAGEILVVVKNIQVLISEYLLQFKNLLAVFSMIYH